MKHLLTPENVGTYIESTIETLGELVVVVRTDSRVSHRT
jgi:hypothetical protein